jgi:hypothetical protein
MGLNLGSFFPIKEGENLILITNNGVVELSCIKSIISTSFSYVDYQLLDKDFLFLKSNEVTDFRIELMDNKIDKTLNPKKVLKIKELFDSIKTK